MNISGVGIITFDESKGYANPAEDEGSLLEQSQEVENYEVYEHEKKVHE